MFREVNWIYLSKHHKKYHMGVSQDPRVQARVVSVTLQDLYTGLGGLVLTRFQWSSLVQS